MSTLIKTPTLQFEVMEIGPKLAEQLLARNSGNRALRKGRVKALAKEMTDGRWMLNGEAIKIGADGRLLDGQHRLAAIVQSGVTVQTLVIRNVEDEAFVTFDSGLARSAGDMLRSAGVEASAVAVAALVNLVLAYEDGTAGYSTGVHTPRTATFDRFSEAPETFTECVRAASRLLARFKGHNRSYVGLLMFMAPESEAFLEKVTSGVGLEAGDPAAALRNFLYNTRQKAVYRYRGALLAGYIHAWNAEVQGRKLQLVRPTLDPFPKIARVPQKG